MCAGQALYHWAIEPLSSLVIFGNLYLLGRENLGEDGEEKEYDQNILC